MIGYSMAPSGGTHQLRKKGGAHAFERIVEFLERCTDCTAVERAEPPELAGDLAQVTARLRDLEAGGTIYRGVLNLTFRMKDPATGELMPYTGPAPSTMMVFVHNGGNASFYAGWYWPYDEVGPEIIRFHDAVDETMGVKLSPNKFVRSDAKGKFRRFRFERGAYTATAADDRSAALLAAIVASPDDDGPRLAYADWLTQQGDPRGELIVVQCRLATLPAGDPAREPLERRERALLKQHGRKWRFIPHLVDPVLRRGFIEIARPRDVTTFLKWNAEEVFAAVPTLREIVVRYPHEVELVRQSKYANRLTARIEPAPLTSFLARAQRR